MAKKAKILELLEVVAPILPAPIYWEDINSIILGGNESVFKATGAGTAAAYIGKTLFELYPREMAEHIKLHNEEVMRTGKILSQEEMILDITTGELKYFTAIKAPLRDADGSVIGIVGTSVDITAEKEAEKLRLENEIQRNLAKKQEQFTEIANQVAHDIRSPLASLSMIVGACLEIPEKERIALRDVSTRISDIANNLLQQYKSQDLDPSSTVEDPQPLLVSATLLQFLTEKKFQYQDTSIQFVHEMSQKSQFSFILADASFFKRMMSNLVNNAVDSLEKKTGIVTVRLDSDETKIKIIIEDNGKGMSPKAIRKIMGSISFTEGKADGHGIGLTQVRNTLKHIHGKMLVESKIGVGSKIILEFPRSKAPIWIAEAIKLGEKDIVVILDDDRSIHIAWEARFKKTNLKLHHFETYSDAFCFIHSLSNEEKNRVFLLTDYELVKQKWNGLDLVKNTNVKRSILVTSHYANIGVQKRANRLNTKILPKQLASEIPITVEKETLAAEEKIGVQYRLVDAVIVDDDKDYLKSLDLYLFEEKDRIDYFSSVREFKHELSQYPKNTLIYLDNHFDSEYISGMDVAHELHQLGYTNLCLLTGDILQDKQLPPYLTAICKMDIDKIKTW